MAKNYRILLTKDARRFLSEHDGDLRADESRFLHKLVSESWRDWMDSANTTIWREQEGNRVLFTQRIRDNIVVVWERVWSIDLFGKLSYPPGTYYIVQPPPADFFPHIVVYEFGPLSLSTDNKLLVEGVAYEATDSLDELTKIDDEFFSRTPGDELTYKEEELFLLSPDRIDDFLSGQQRGLPLHMADEQVEALRSQGPVLLSGEAGSGKTIVITHWLVINHIRYLQTEKEPLRQLFVTFSKRLRDKARATFEEMLPHEYQEHRTRFLTYRELLIGILESAKRGTRNEVLEMDFERFMHDYSIKVIPSVDPVLIWDEIRSVLKGSAIPPKPRFLDFAAYQTRSEERGQCKTPVEFRGQYYDAAQTYQNFLDREGLWDAVDLAYECVNILDSKKDLVERYDRIACDEVQDLAPVEISLLIRLLRDGLVENAFFTGDMAQVINPSGFQWSRLKGDMGEYCGGRTIRPERHLERNFRTSKEIIGLVNSVLNVRGEILADEISRNLQKSFNSTGLKPMVIKQNPLKTLREAISNPQERLILVKNNAAKNKLRESLKESADSYTILTVEESKGLEWDGVLLWRFFVPRHEKITKNDWEAMFVPAKKASLADGIKRGTRNPYALAYEFNLLHVAFTRSRRLLFIFDDDPTMKIENLSDRISAVTDVIDADAFRVHWETAEPSPQQLHDLAERLQETDKEQSLVFYTRAAKGFEKQARESDKPSDWKSAATCYEAAKSFELAASCYHNGGDLTNEHRCMAIAHESQSKWKDAGNMWVKYGELLEKEGLWGTDPFWKAKENYHKAQELDLEAEAATKCANSIPQQDKAERAEKRCIASECWAKAGQPSEAIKQMKIAIADGEQVRQDGVHQSILGIPVASWLASCYTRLGELYRDRGELSTAATEFDHATSLLHTNLGDTNLSGIERERCGEQFEAASINAIELYIQAGRIKDAQETQVTLAQHLGHQLVQNRTFLSHFMSIWGVLAKMYGKANQPEAYSSTILQQCKILWDANEKREAIATIRDAAELMKSTSRVSPAIELFEELAKRSEMVEEYETAAMACIEIASLCQTSGRTAAALEKRMSAGEYLMRAGPEQKSRPAQQFEEVVKLARDEIGPSEAGWYAFREIALGKYIKQPQEMSKWVRRATIEFQGEPGKSIRRLRGYANSLQDALNLNRTVGSTKENDEKSLGWTLLCLALIDKSSQTQYVKQCQRAFEKYYETEGREIESTFPELFKEER